ncbi:MAG: NPCBM/NEW2 domain-containing protein [Paludibacter sp.]
MRKALIFSFCLLYMFAMGQKSNSSTVSELWLDELDINKIETGWSISKANKSIDSHPLTVAGREYEKGVGTHAISKVLLNLYGSAKTFQALVGVDDEVTSQGSIEFYVLCDRKVLFRSGIMKKGDLAKEININLKGVQQLALLVTDANDGISFDHADWLNARIKYSGNKPSIAENTSQSAYILTPKPSELPRINGARITGANPGNPFLYTVAVTGKRPMTFSADGLPDGLTLGNETGIISGKTDKEGEYLVKITTRNELGSATRTMKIVIGKNKLALTPPMGWNSWNCWGLSVSAEKVKASANAMVSSGLINHGWMYINIDDGWEASQRADNGDIVSNEKFPDMKQLSDYVHAKGLKMGIYSSPGRLTCGGYLGSLNYEQQDAAMYARWGIDYLKYDWCSYGEEFDKTNKSRAEYMKPYITMRNALAMQNRDIVHSLCQYGMDNVWEWGGETGQLWRTTGDITDTWQSMSDIGFSQTINSRYAKPGNWNDPDMLVVGKVGWGPSLHSTRLTPDEQYTHISLWAMLASPLLIGGDMSQLDEFTLSLLTNDEVIDVNQDPLGKQAICVSKQNGKEVWMKELEDGSKAVGLFNRGDDKNVSDMFNWDQKEKASTMIKIDWSELGIAGKQQIRNIWTQKDIIIQDKSFETMVPYHGVVLVRISQLK